ncbi:MAG: ParB/RepB/Spo0J family partition protein [Acidobacteria bacterium]|nr:ParB/RepB/Spo0J family partition protein [Acidobacteriota bacterium]
MVRKALGRGLDTILPISSEERSDLPKSVAQEIPIILIDPNPEQPRTVMDKKALSELSQSIKQQGVIQPLIVKQVGERYQLIAGERRLRACEMAGLSKVPVVIKDIDQDDLLMLALIENIQREDLNPLEEAQAYDTLMKEKNLTQEELSNVVGKERSTIANTVRLLKLPRYAREALSDGQISGGHARTLLMLENDPDAMKNLFNLIVNKGISVREAESFVKKLRETVEKAEKIQREEQTDPYVNDAERKLCDKLSARVKINKDAAGRGSILINFASDEDLQRLFDTLMTIRY